ncbi:MAG: flagellar export protein FliJ [Bacteroidales bacterium]|nr:flagellar export protein FliJ [Bacteroidales bacterium]MCM1415140.1 flagellar export protein FliJ [bacterium]MCM1423024.1 flagellar export protein FliJ [bacterium]
MARFRYRMQSILNIKYQLETQAKMELGKAQMRLTEEEEKLQTLFDRKEAYLEEGRQMRKETVNVNDLRDNRNAVLVMDELIAAQQLEVLRAAEVVELARAKLTEIMQDRKMHEKLKEKALLQFLEDEKKAEAKIVDELTSYTYGQRGKESGDGSGSDEYGDGAAD